MRRWPWGYGLRAAGEFDGDQAGGDGRPVQGRRDREQSGGQGGAERTCRVGLLCWAVWVGRCRLVADVALDDGRAVGHREA